MAAVTSASGQVVEKYIYDAYGAQTRTVMPGQTASGFGKGFTGYIADNETGLLHARAREYSPTLGRFIGRDAYHEGDISAFDYGFFNNTEILYVNGYGLYMGYLVPNSTDPYGYACWCSGAGAPLKPTVKGKMGDERITMGSVGKCKSSSSGFFQACTNIFCFGNCRISQNWRHTGADWLAKDPSYDDCLGN
ncbi:MAG TPA: hypothetical protein DCS97_14295 [Planctomycetes bacterium]|nr:hypothetical protein [Planctomycetota bacterium]